MQYRTVYSPDGEFFEVPENRFAYLVLEKGWSQVEPLVLENPLEEAEDTEVSSGIPVFVFTEDD